MNSKAEKQKLWREQKQAYRKSRKEYALILGLNESKILEDYAKNKNMSATEFMKALIKAYQNNTEYILPKENMLRELIIEMRRIGNNINQIARFINTNKVLSLHDFKMLEKHLSRLEKQIATALTNPLKKES